MKRHWSISEAAFHQLLAWFDGGRDSGGERFLEIRRRLVSYFDRKGCLLPDELADETLNRVARRLEEQGSIEATAPERYCYIVARFVFLESLDTAARQPVSLDALPAFARDQALSGTSATSVEDGIFEDSGSQEKRFEYLQSCLDTLEAHNRDLIFAFYHGEQRVKIDNRRRLAERLGLTANALNIRACRIRSRLEECVARRMAEACGVSQRSKLPAQVRDRGQAAK